ncbi:hypothetical protein [uncultured Helicobacter sp.]|uniref:hypothetical protein n=1 Tax=uncultured Helicobacter sp. TaxID=175537 RepID=UPI0026167882|nr:hypothetical protein [uncultured Helicobacter sp.]
MQKEILIFSSIFVIVLVLLIALFIALKREKPRKIQEESNFEIPNASTLLESLKKQNNDLNTLAKYADLAFIHYDRYMEEMPDFDLEFFAILTSHKGVNAKLILEVERHFKQANPARKELLEQALNVGLKHR